MTATAHARQAQVESPRVLLRLHASHGAHAHNTGSAWAHAYIDCQPLLATATCRWSAAGWAGQAVQPIMAWHCHESLVPRRTRSPATAYLSSHPFAL